jgi:hypothetical protein
MTISKSVTANFALVLATILAALAFSASHAKAAGIACENMWYARNLIAHRAGYCFGSELGQSMFGNDGCTGKNPTMSEADRERVRQFAALEKSWGCDVDTSATMLKSDVIPFIADLERFAFRDDTESSCGGYKGPRIALHAGPSSDTAIVGYIEPGNSILSSYILEKGWEMLEVNASMENSQLRAVGWTPEEVFSYGCEFMAG